MSVVKRVGVAAALVGAALAEDGQPCVMLEPKESYQLTGVVRAADKALCLYVPRIHNANPDESHLSQTLQFTASLDMKESKRSSSSSSSSSSDSSSSEHGERKCSLVVKPKEIAKGSLLGKTCEAACPSDSNEMCWCLPIETDKGNLGDEQDLAGSFVTDKIFGGKYWADLTCKGSLTHLSVFDGQIDGKKALKLQGTALSGSKATTDDDGAVTGLAPMLLGGKHSVHLLLRNSKDSLPKTAAKFPGKQHGRHGRRLLDPEMYVVEFDVVENTDPDQNGEYLDDTLSEEELEQEVQSIFNFVNDMISSLSQSFFEINMEGNDMIDAPIPQESTESEIAPISIDEIAPETEKPKMIAYPSSHPKAMDIFVLAESYDSEQQVPLEQMKLRGGVQLAMKTQGTGDVLFSLTPLEKTGQNGLFKDNQATVCRVRPGQTECKVVIPTGKDFALDITNFGAENDVVSFESRGIPRIHPHRHQPTDHGEVVVEGEGDKAGLQTWVKVMLLSAFSVILVALFGFGIMRLRKKREYKQINEPGVGVHLPTLDNYEAMQDEESLTDQANIAVAL